MSDNQSTLIVRRIGGLIRRPIQRGLAVMLEGQKVGVVGEELAVDPGTRTVTVKVPYFTCRPLEVEIQPASTTVLEYRST